MPGTLVDSNVILDVFTDDPMWAPWSSTALANALESGPVAVNPIIYAEVSVRFTRIEDLEAALPAREFRRAALPWSAAFLAAKAFAVHRRRRPSSETASATPLPDFFIGAHAAVADFSLLTRDPTRYRAYFPTVRLVTPDG